jgi:hypothetical protein
MKLKLKNFFVAIVLTVLALSVNAQSTIPKGKSQLIEFTNSTAKFAVPEGKTWYIYNIFCERTFTKGTEEKEACILFKSINDIIFNKGEGPSVYYYNTALIVNFPIVFTEKTQFELEIFNSGKKAIITYVEVDN